MLIYLRQALNEYPRIELTQLTWRIVDRLEGSDKVQKSVQQTAGAVTPAAAAATGWVSVEIHAQLPLGLVSDQRAQLELIDSFAERLRDPKTDVRVLRRPFDIESDKPLKSTGKDGEAQPADVPKFALRIARPL
jgi:hypothetical protein